MDLLRTTEVAQLAVLILPIGPAASKFLDWLSVAHLRRYSKDLDALKLGESVADRLNHVGASSEAEEVTHLAWHDFDAALARRDVHREHPAIAYAGAAIVVTYFLLIGLALVSRHLGQAMWLSWLILALAVSCLCSVVIWLRCWVVDSRRVRERTFERLRNRWLVDHPPAGDSPEAELLPEWIEKVRP